MIVRIGEREWQEGPKNRDRAREKKTTCHAKPSLLLEASTKKAVCVGMLLQEKIQFKIHLWAISSVYSEMYGSVCAWCVLVCVWREEFSSHLYSASKKGWNEKGFMTANSHDAPMSDIVVECAQNSWLDSISTGLDISLNIYTQHKPAPAVQTLGKL